MSEVHAEPNNRSEFDYEELAHRFRAMLVEWVDSTPTDKEGDYDPINQPQAYKADKLLRQTRGIFANK